MFLLNLLQAHGQEAGHGAQPAEAAGHAAAAHAEHVPFIVEKLNHWIGEPVFELQKVIMPPIYKYLKIFGPEWPGEDKTFQQYLDAGYLPIPTHVVMFLFVMVVAVVILTILRGKLSVESPNNRQQSFEVGVEAIRSLLSDLVGTGGMKHFPVVATFGILILLSNLTGMLPDMVAPTANFNVTLALAITSFLYYNYVGIMFFLFPIEIFSNLARIMSLSIRLFGNIFGEEQLSGAISSLAQWILPVVLMPLGLLTSVIQTFIFVLLSMVYLGVR